eukprot:1159504-Pelagomonas_calceolata.AAC.16
MCVFKKVAILMFIHCTVGTACIVNVSTIALAMSLGSRLPVKFIFETDATPVHMQRQQPGPASPALLAAAAAAGT